MSVLRRALDFEIAGKRKTGRPERTSKKKQADKESMKVGQSREDEPCQSK